MSATAALMLAGLFAGCSAQHVVRTVVPAGCQVATIKSFTKPCQDTKDGYMMCDRVRVKVNCVAARREGVDDRNQR